MRTSANSEPNRPKLQLTACKLCPEKSEPPKDFATICVNLHKITHTATCISNDVLKFLENNSYSDSEIKL